MQTGDTDDHQPRSRVPRERLEPYRFRRGLRPPRADLHRRSSRGQSCSERSDSLERRHLSFRRRLSAIRVCIIKFELARHLCFVGCVVFVNEAEAEFNAVLTEDVTHRPAVDSSESRRITERNLFTFVERNCGRNTLVLVVFEVFTHELSQRIALTPKHTSLNSTLDEEIEIVRIGASDAGHRSGIDYVFILFMNCTGLPYALRTPVSTSVNIVGDEECLERIRSSGSCWSTIDDGGGEIQEDLGDDGFRPPQTRERSSSASDRSLGTHSGTSPS